MWQWKLQIYSALYTPFLLFCVHNFSVCAAESVRVSHSVLSDSLRPHGRSQSLPGFSVHGILQLSRMSKTSPIIKGTSVTGKFHPEKSDLSACRTCPEFSLQSQDSGQKKPGYHSPSHLPKRASPGEAFFCAFH